MKLSEVFCCLFLTFQIKLVTSILKQFNPSYHNKCQTHWHSEGQTHVVGFSSRQKPESPELNTSGILFQAEKNHQAWAFKTCTVMFFLWRTLLLPGTCIPTIFMAPAPSCHCMPCSQFSYIKAKNVTSSNKQIFGKHLKLKQGEPHCKADA